MRIQELAIIFVIIILPISLLLSEYSKFQINTLSTQTLYDTRLTSATYDAIRAFQLNTTDSTTSDIANSKMRDLSASVNTFRNSITASFKLNGYTADQLNNYIPALVYTLYDGFYIYSPYENKNYRYLDSTGESITKIDAKDSDIKADGNGEKIYGLKPYISYSCRYQKGNIDVIITYALDNYVTVQGTIGEEYVNKSGYLIDGIAINGDNIKYNGVSIETERLCEQIGDEIYPYAKINGTKYYLMEEDENVVYISNGTIRKQYKKSENPDKYEEYRRIIENNNYARQYYKDAYEFTYWFKNSELQNLTYGDAVDEIIDEVDGSVSIGNVWAGDTKKIFEFNSSTTDASKNIENESSSFNQHRLAVIRHKIETNLAIAIANYNSYSGATSNVFQMPELKENEWDQITHNIALISFLQGLPIGGKIYNGYSIVTNTESKEVVLENYIYILGADGAYHRIGDNYLQNAENIDSGDYGDKKSAGRLSLDFERITLNNSTSEYYYYPLKGYNASYNSVVMQNDVTIYDDVYAYVNEQNEALKEAFYTALGRERAGQNNYGTI